MFARAVITTSMSFWGIQSVSMYLAYQENTNLSKYPKLPPLTRTFTLSVCATGGTTIHINGGKEGRANDHGVVSAKLFVALR